MKKWILAILAILLAVSCVSNGGDMVNEDFPEPDKLCVLTFDDGPNTVKTGLVLDKLEAHNVPATFFVVGQNIGSSTEEIMQRALALGCDFQNHSWSYSGMNGMTAEQISTSIDKTSQAIERVTGSAPAFFRPPNLATSATMYDTIAMPFISGVVAVDWAGTGTTAQDRADNVLNGMRDGAIILLHDVQPDPHPTPEALDILIPELKRRGYQFVTLPELFEMKGVDPDSKSNDMWVYVN